MDTQMKKGILEGCVLAVLKKEESYGYKIIADLSKVLIISESTLYPILKRLEATDCVRTTSREYNGRLRKYYKLTSAGDKKLGEFVRDLEQFKEIYKFILEEQQ